MTDRQQNIEFGIVLSLVLLLLAHGWDIDTNIWTIGTLLLALLMPKVYTPFTWLWFKFAEKLGRAMTFILLLIVFWGIVTPVGLLRSLLKKDSLQLRKFGKGSKSVFIESSKTYSARELEKQF